MAEHNASYRMRILIISSLAAALLILVRFAFIMLSSDRSDGTPIPVPAVAERGPIIDRNGRIVALQTRLWSVTAWKPEIDDPIRTGKILGEALGEDAQAISRMLAGGSASRFLFVKRQVSPTESDAVRALIEAGELPGIGLQEELGRHYPMKELAAPLIGHVGTDNVGLDGIEYAFDRVLAPGQMTTGAARLYGNTVRLTLDMDTQFVVERIAVEALEEYNPDSLMILVMDAKSAEILSWVSLPSFDPNTFTSSTRNQRINRPLTVAYEPGSVFKVFTWATFLDAGGAVLSDIFDTRNGYEPEIFKRYGIPPITDLANYGILDVPGALIRSSNVAVAMASEGISANDFYKSLKNFGFGAPTGLPLPGESHGLLNAVSQWSARSKPTIAIGQEVGVSAIQVVTAATTPGQRGSTAAAPNRFRSNGCRRIDGEGISPNARQGSDFPQNRQDYAGPYGADRELPRRYGQESRRAGLKYFSQIRHCPDYGSRDGELQR
jgi:cell division protein FtsI (penicillin-binding protein 3)